jgi:hypothetical protein
VAIPQAAPEPDCSYVASNSAFNGRDAQDSPLYGVSWHNFDDPRLSFPGAPYRFLTEEQPTTELSAYTADKQILYSNWILS